MRDKSDSSRRPIAFIVVCIIVVGGFLSLPIMDGEICKQYANASNAKCSANDILLVLARPYGEWFRWIEPGLLAFSTLALAIFTWRLWWSTQALVSGAEKTAERQLRAYVTIKVGPQMAITSGRFIIVARNTGQTPAHNVCARINWQQIAHGLDNLPDGFTYPDGTGNGRFSSVSVLGAGRKQPITFNIPRDEVMEVLNGKIDLFFYGHIDYDDVFGNERRRSNFCYQYFSVSLNGGTTHNLVMYREYNDAT